MSLETTLSKMELDFLQETFDLVLEEFEGIEEIADNYTLTTGAYEMAQEASGLIASLYDNLHEHDYEEELDYGTEEEPIYEEDFENDPPWED